MELMSFEPLVWLAIVVLMAISLRYSLVDQTRWKRLASFALRVAGIGLLIVALCRPFWAQQSDDLHVVFLVDVSQSVNLAGAKDSLAEIRRSIDNLRAADSWSLFAVGDRVKRFDDVAGLEQLLKKWQTSTSDDRFRSASRLANALLDTRLAFPAGKARRVVLYSDGQDTDADLEAAVAQLEQESIDVRLVKIAGLKYPEASVLSVEPSTPQAFQGEVVRMTVKLAANKPMSGKLRIVHKGVAVLDREVKLEAGRQNLVHFDVNMTTPGASLWTAELVPAEDHFPINNQSSCTVTVRGQPRVLVLHEKQNEMRSFARALDKHDFDVEVRGKFGMPNSMEELLAFDAVMLADLPATSLTPRQMELLKRYVIDFGGGLVMLGSENSFGLGGYYKTPVEEVLPLVSRFEKEKEKPSLAMVLVIDKSGSMDGLPIALARQAAKAAVELLSTRDMVGVVGFDSQPSIVCEMRSGAEKGAIQAAIDSLAAGGGTYMYPAMVAGKEMLENAPAKIRHMILLSDGQTQPADHEGLTQAMADAGITVSTIALGEADRQLLAGIAELGHGRYYETNDPANVPQIFTKETMQASRSAIKEDLFGTVIMGDHPILAGYREADLPFTLGYVMTEVKPTAQLLLVAETGDPLLAVSRYGLGMGMAFTSDLTERWGGQWLAWDRCGQFWAQALRSVVRKSDAEGFDVASQRTATGWDLQIKRTAADGTPVDAVRWDAFTMDDNGQMHALPVEQIGLGRYSAQLPLAGNDHLTLRLRDRDHEKMRILHFHRSYPAEYRLGQGLPPVVAKLPSIAPDEIRQSLTPQRRRKSIEHYASLAALVCLLGSVLLRRL